MCRGAGLMDAEPIPGEARDLDPPESEKPLSRVLLQYYYNHSYDSTTTTVIVVLQKHYYSY